MVSKNLCLALCLVPVLLIEMYCPEIPTSVSQGGGGLQEGACGAGSGFRDSSTLAFY